MLHRGLAEERPFFILLVMTHKLVTDQFDRQD